MKLTKRLTAICLSALLAVGAAAPALAKEAEPSEKEEVIYATLNGDGSLRNTYVVNSFSGGNITDYGSYTSVKILNTNDPIQQNGDTITFSTSAQKAYYQGELADAELPWNISLRITWMETNTPLRKLRGKAGNWKSVFKSQTTQPVLALFSKITLCRLLLPWTRNGAAISLPRTPLSQVWAATNS